MNPAKDSLEAAVDSLLETMPPVWDRIRGNLRQAAIGRFGISLEQFHILRHIRKGCCSVSDLAEKKRITRPAVSQAVDILVSKGLVTREEVSEDRRHIRLSLTPWASEVLDANFAENRTWMKGKMASLSPSERTSICKAMEALRETFIPGES